MSVCVCVCLCVYVCVCVCMFVTFDLRFHSCSWFGTRWKIWQMKSWAFLSTRRPVPHWGWCEAASSSSSCWSCVPFWWRWCARSLTTFNATHESFSTKLSNSKRSGGVRRCCCDSSSRRRWPTRWSIRYRQSSGRHSHLALLDTGQPDSPHQGPVAKLWCWTNSRVTGDLRCMRGWPCGVGVGDIRVVIQ